MDVHHIVIVRQREGHGRATMMRATAAAAAAAVIKLAAVLNTARYRNRVDGFRTHRIYCVREVIWGEGDRMHKDFVGDARHVTASL